ncbi:bola protein [Dioszegia hungarica]|uniref:Bola protein n=1 Tax=Dioszegia hungarica TaxID=4972 RepID=A0AA38HBW4_9TREE|nr:bola protein [Dioszegia hungarica]KAI9637566.1 bola protein [Dioszegia hungarica]
MDTQPVQGATNGENDESVLLNEEGVAGGSITKRIEDKVRAGLKVEHFEIVDTSGNCGSSFAIIVVSPDFAKKLPLARHKMVNQLLTEEIAQLHAFSQRSLTPEQWAKEKR